MNEHAPHQFADDSPKSNPWTDDSLGFAKFSERVAGALVRQEAPSGYVVGLHGEWGSGKSTVLNFVRSHLGKWKDESRPDMENLQWFDFEPWVVSGHQDLASAFFKGLSEKLSDRADAKSRFRRHTKDAIDMGAGPLIDTVSKLGFIIDHTGGMASKAGAAVTKAAIKKGSEKWLAEPSLQKTYEQLVTRLRASGRHFVVFVDDIDRLTAAEIRSLMQMVKTIGRLPNVTYCLSYDREIVWAALKELAPGDGFRSGYAEKIVQHELEVPVPSRSGLMRMLYASLPDLPPNPGGMRWIEILQHGLNRWIRHPRDVVRLGNAMHFSWAALNDEVDAYDMLCMEALRLFDRKVFDWIRDNRDLLLGEGVPYPLDEKESDENAEALARELRIGERADIIPLLRVLFANKTKAFGSRRGFSAEQWSDVVNRRGIATPAGFSAYFSLAPSPSAVPKRFVDEAAAVNTTHERQVELIDQAIGLLDEQGVTLVGQYFQELSFRVGGMASAELPILLRALIDRTEEVSGVNDARGVFGPSSAHHTLVGAVIDKLGAEVTADVLDEAFAEPGRLGALAALYVDLGYSIGAIPSAGVTLRTRIPPERLPSLGAALLPKIVAGANADTLTDLPHYYEVARAWSHIAGIQAPRDWLAREAKRNGHSLAKLSIALLGTSNDDRGIRYSFYRSPQTDLYDVEAIAEGCEVFIDSPDLSDDERLRITALRDGLATLKRQDEARRTRGDDV